MEVIKPFGAEDGRKCVSVIVCLCLTVFASGLMHLSLSHVCFTVQQAFQTVKSMPWGARAASYGVFFL